MEIANPPLLLFDRNPLPLDREIHAGLTIAAISGRYAFAAQAQTVFMAMVEFFDACRQFSIIFTRSGDDRIVPLALIHAHLISLRNLSGLNDGKAAASEENG